MSVDKLVDSTLLDAACTYEAGKIREKLGSSAQIAYDLANGKGFGDAIAAIPTGGGGGISVRKGAVQIQNSHGSQFGCNRIRYGAYSSGISWLGVYNSNIANGATLTESYMAIFDDGNGDGEYFVFHTNGSFSALSCTYNGLPVAVVTAGTGGQWDIRIYLPSGFDNSYPFVIT